MIERPQTSDCTHAGVWITVRRPDETDDFEPPRGKFALGVNGPDGCWFAVDAAGNVRGDPYVVEREMLAIGVEDNLVALAALGLARIAIKARGPLHA